jgi:hypothetical protein
MKLFHFTKFLNEIKALTWFLARDLTGKEKENKKREKNLVLEASYLAYGLILYNNECHGEVMLDWEDWKGQNGTVLGNF